jgi:hypothetical protein
MTTLVMVDLMVLLKEQLVDNYYLRNGSKLHVLTFRLSVYGANETQGSKLSAFKDEI